MFRIEVIVKAVFNGRANSEFYAREEMLDSLGHDMGCCMAKGIFASLIVKGKEFYGRAVGDGFTQVRDFTIYQYFFCQAVAQLFDGFGKGNAISKFFLAAIFQN